MIQDDVEHLLGPLIHDLGYVLWGCQYLIQGKTALLRVYIDHDNGIAVEDCVTVSREASAILDVDGGLERDYTLEVSSPGIPRPLFKPAQYEKYLGQEVDIKLYSPVSGQRKWSGLIQAVKGDTLTLDVKGTLVDVQFSNIVKANIG